MRPARSPASLDRPHGPCSWRQLEGPTGAGSRELRRRQCSQAVGGRGSEESGSYLRTMKGGVYGTAKQARSRRRHVHSDSEEIWKLSGADRCAAKSSSSDYDIMCFPRRQQRLPIPVAPTAGRPDLLAQEVSERPFSALDRPRRARQDLLEPLMGHLDCLLLAKTNNGRA